MRIAALAAATVLLAGCTGGDDGPAYDASDYRTGACSAASRAAFSIDSAVDGVAEGDTEPADTTEELKQQQADLIDAVEEMTEPEVKAAAQKVVDAVGFYRIGVDAGNFTRELASDVETASRELLQICSAE